MAVRLSPAQVVPQVLDARIEYRPTVKTEKRQSIIHFEPDVFIRIEDHLQVKCKVTNLKKVIWPI